MGSSSLILPYSPITVNRDNLYELMETLILVFVYKFTVFWLALGVKFKAIP